MLIVAILNFILKILKDRKIVSLKKITVKCILDNMENYVDIETIFGNK